MGKGACCKFYECACVPILISSYLGEVPCTPHACLHVSLHIDLSLCLKIHVHVPPFIKINKLIKMQVYFAIFFQLVSYFLSLVENDRHVFLMIHLGFDEYKHKGCWNY
jgi:hypothetical protein